MKKLLILGLSGLLGLSSVPALAQHRHGGMYATGVPHHHRHYHHRHYHHGGHWVAPLIIGGVVGYAITRNNQDTVIVQQPPMIVTEPTPVSPPLVDNTSCGPWIETLQPNGTIVRQRTCTQ